jgi:hypothetical protein
VSPVGPTIELTGERWEAGGVVRGTARAPAGRLRVRLWWAARAGGGGKDWIEIADEVEGDGSELAFELRVPAAGPVSFDGSLVRVLWSVAARVTVDGEDLVEQAPIEVAPAAGDTQVDAEACRQERATLHRAEQRATAARGVLLPALRGGFVGVLTGLVILGTGVGSAEVAAACALAVGVGATALDLWRGRGLTPSVRFAGEVPALALGQSLRLELEAPAGRALFWRLGWTEAAEELEVEHRRGSVIEHRPWRELRQVVERGRCGPVIEVTLPRTGPTQLVRERRTIVWWVEVDEAEGTRSATVIVPLAVLARVVEP